MASTIDSVSESVRASLEDVSATDRDLFLAEKERAMKQQIIDSPLLDQLCWVRLIRLMLSEGHSKLLAEYEDKLKERTEMVRGWRKSPTTKSASEYEGPMPWLHPFKLAGEALEPLEESLETAVTSGQTEEGDLEALKEVLDRYKINLPLQLQAATPRFPPRPLRIYD